MKTLKNTLLALLFIGSLTACSSDDDAGTTSNSSPANISVNGSKVEFTTVRIASSNIPGTYGLGISGANASDPIIEIVLSSPTSELANGTYIINDSFDDNTAIIEYFRNLNDSNNENPQISSQSGTGNQGTIVVSQTDGQTNYSINFNSSNSSDTITGTARTPRI